MNLLEIKKYLQNLENILKSFNFDVNENNGAYVCHYGNEQCLVVPYIASIEVSWNNFQNYNNVIIVGDNFDITECLKYKHISLDELANLLELRDTSADIFNKLVMTIFFNHKISILLNSIKSMAENIKAFEPTNKETKDVKVQNNKDCKSDNKIDISIIEDYLSIKLQKNKKIYNNDETGIVAIVSKLYEDKKQYWYGYHDYQIELLKKYKKSYIAYFFKDKKCVLLIPLELMERYRQKLNSTKNANGEYWHIYLSFVNDHCLWRIPNNGFLDVTEYLINVSKKIDDNKIELKSHDNEVVIKIKNNNSHAVNVKK